MGDTCFLVNPFSGGKKGRALCDLLRARGVKNVIELDLSRTPEQFAAARGHGLIVLGGGDGTVSHALQALRGYAGRIAVFPLGTANDLARELGLFPHFSMQHIERMIALVENTSGRPFSLWEAAPANGSGPRALFCNYLSLGWDAAVVGDVDDWRRRDGLRVLFRGGVASNRAAYAAAALARLGRGRLRGVEVRALEGSGPSFRIERAMSLLFPNIRSIMGFGCSSPFADPHDETIEAIAVTSVAQYFAMVARRVIALRAAVRPQARGWEIHGVPPGTALQVDGEIRRDFAAESYRISHAGKITMTFVGPEKERA
jgi:diacylglycerol kinase family enzyme